MCLLSKLKNEEKSDHSHKKIDVIFIVSIQLILLTIPARGLYSSSSDLGALTHGRRVASYGTSISLSGLGSDRSVPLPHKNGRNDGRPLSPVERPPPTKQFVFPAPATSYNILHRIQDIF